MKHRRSRTKNVEQKRRSTRSKPVAEAADGDVYTMEALRDYKVISGTEYFMVKWEGFDERENTWEPECNLLRPNQELLEQMRALREKHSRKRKAEALDDNAVAQGYKRRRPSSSQCAQATPSTFPFRREGSSLRGGTNYAGIDREVYVSTDKKSVSISTPYVAEVGQKSEVGRESEFGQGSEICEGSQICKESERGEESEICRGAGTGQESLISQTSEFSPETEVSEESLVDSQESEVNQRSEYTHDSEIIDDQVVILSTSTSSECLDAISSESQRSRTDPQETTPPFGESSLLVTPMSASSEVKQPLPTKATQAPESTASLSTTSPSAVRVVKFYRMKIADGSNKENVAPNCLEQVSGAIVALISIEIGEGVKEESMPIHEAADLYPKAMLDYFMSKVKYHRSGVCLKNKLRPTIQHSSATSKISASER